MPREPEHPEVAVERRGRTRFLITLAIIAAASYYGAHLGAMRGASDAAAIFAHTGPAPSGKPYATAYAGEPASSDRCASTIADLTRTLAVQAIGVTPDGDVARFNDPWFADVRVVCPPRSAVLLGWEHPALPSGAVDMAAGYAAAVFGADRGGAARDLAEACRLAQTDGEPPRHGDVEAKLYRVSCDQPETRDGFVVSINARS